MLISVCLLPTFTACRPQTDSHPSQRRSAEPAQAPPSALSVNQTSAIPPPEDVLTHDFDHLVEAAAAQYASWRRVSDQARIAPALCRPPLVGQPLLSRSRDSATHGQKLYYLYAKHDGYSYIRSENPKQAANIGAVGGPEMQATPEEVFAPVGQVIVKESWITEQVPSLDAPSPVTEFDASTARIVNANAPRPASAGPTHLPCKPGPLFFMLKLDPATPDTDQGWIYATLTVDASGKPTIIAGRIASCMECHTQAPHGRLFGLPADQSAP